MTLDSTAAAIERMQSVLRRRPDKGLSDDEPAVSRWERGTRVTSGDAKGMRITTEMPAVLGGSGNEVTPGWLLRAGLASCAASSIVMTAAAQGVEPSRLEVVARSRSDARGLFGMPGSDGEPVFSGPGDVQLLVRIAARAVEPQRLRALVEEALRCSPVPNALSTPTPLSVLIEAESD